MTERATSRRTVLEAGACALIAAAGVPQIAAARAEARLSSQSEEAIRNYYAAWEKKDWHRVESVLGEDFTFSSPLDDHISKSDYKTGCWDTQVAFIDRFDLKQVIATDHEAFVMYICHTANGKTFQNVEYFQLRGGKVKTVECYFGGKASFPSGVSTGKG
jgi:ketosteroid isomerase-like protein